MILILVSFVTFAGEYMLTRSFLHSNSVHFPDYQFALRR